MTRRIILRLEAVGARRFALFTVLFYAALALLAYLPSWPGDPSRSIGGCYACGDTIQGAWFLEWVPWAILHGHNIFFTTRMYYPSGANLAINTEMPLLGLISAPLSYAVNPIASYNLLMWAAFPLSGAAAYALVRRTTHSNLAAAASGLLYGFSSYLGGEAYGHLNLSFVPFPPLIFLALYEVLVAQRSHQVRWGIGLGLLCACQFLVSPEILATTAIMAAIGLLVLVCACRHLLDRRRLRLAAQALVPGLFTLVIIIAVPAYFMVRGPERYTGTVQSLMNPFHADLLGPITPTTTEAVAPASVISFGDKFAEYFPENGSYIGIPLLLICVWCAIRFRRNRWIIFSAAMAAVALLLSLGPKLAVANHLTPIPLPFDIIGRLPLLGNVLPSRISLYQDLFIDILVGLGIGEGLKTLAASEATPVLRRNALHLSGAVATVLGVTAVVSLAPRWPLQTEPTAPGIPSLFTSSTLQRAIPYDAVVLTYPFSVAPGNQAMAWQAVDRLRFTLVGGYALEPSPSGSVSPWPPDLTPLDVQEFLGFEDLGPSGYLSPVAPRVNEALIRDVRTYIERNHVTTVIFAPYSNYASTAPAAVLDVFERALGHWTVSEGGVDIWRDSQRLAAEHHD